MIGQLTHQSAIRTIPDKNWLRFKVFIVVLSQASRTKRLSAFVVVVMQIFGLK